MSKKNGYYIPLPEDFLDQPKIQKLIAKSGLGAVTIFHDLQTRMRDYENDSETSFMIPFEDLSFLCRRYCISKEELQQYVNLFYALDLIKVYEITDKATGTALRFFYSEDILENCLNWAEKRKYMAEIGRRGGQRRRISSNYKQEGDEDEN